MNFKRVITFRLAPVMEVQRTCLFLEAKDLGGNIYPVECLNTNKNWCKDFAKYTFTQAEGSAQDKEDIEYKLDKKYYQEMPELVMNKT